MNEQQQPDQRPLPPLPDTNTSPTLPPLPEIDETADVNDEDGEIQEFDNPPMRNVGLFARPFSFRGRITRLEFLLSHLVFALLGLVGYMASVYTELAALWVGQEAAQTVSHRIMLGALAVACWAYTAQGIKRSHDTGKTGWLFYIPFYNIVLLFRRGQTEVNRYGTAPTIHSADTDVRQSIKRMRTRAFFCALAWWICSPVYLVLSAVWRLQRWSLRILLLLLSPFVIWLCSCLTLNHHIQQQHGSLEDTAREAVEALKADIALPVETIDYVGKDGIAADAFELQLKKAEMPNVYAAIDRQLADTASTSWQACPDEIYLSDEDYGYYREDYPPMAQDTAQSNCMALTKRGLKLKSQSDHSVDVRLVIHRDSHTARLVIIGLK